MTLKRRWEIRRQKYNGLGMGGGGHFRLREKQEQGTKTERSDSEV